MPTNPASLINIVEVASSASAESPIRNQPSVIDVNPVPPLSTSNVPVVSDRAMFNDEVETYDGKPDVRSNCKIEPGADVASATNEFAPSA